MADEHAHITLVVPQAEQVVRVQSAYLLPESRPGAARFELGRDLQAMPDLQLHIQAGLRNLAEAIARRLVTPRGRLWYDPEYGYDVRRWLNSAADSAVRYEIARRVEEQCEMDPRVASAEATVEYSAEARELTIRVKLTLADEPSPQIVPADRVTLEVLRATA